MLKYNEDPVNVFIAIFTIMNGAMHAGNTSQYGPDLGKAKSAA